ncbi:uncharacterized protein N7496_005541 [Penicillium cataractarum]|uniref:Uncharacterized protein n=1 Tax=Penicillium cataractarum TaxID=2100454 RepID=A0A9W9VDM8_9EURO|nr:uncharacterized protein N7496_005541 [Penicillium cataractarum]KAJ5378132.1 hypothetical protein N7496_005541 [Penicillium cataractarum]
MKVFSLLVALAPTALAAVGGRCSNNWGADCICLDQNVCSSQYGGQPYTGSPGNYPCPNDPGNVMACVINPCPNEGGNTGCRWNDPGICGNVLSDPVCPGGNDFVCCQF